MRRLTAAGLIGIAGSAVVVLFGWLRAKGLAVALGPEGVGIYGQLWTFVLYAGGLASLGFGVGTGSLAAIERERGSGEGLSTIYWGSVFLPVVTGLALLASTVAASQLISPLLLNREDLLLMLLAAVSLPLVAIQAPLQHFMHGLEDVVGQNVTYAIYAAGFTGVSVAGAFVFGVEGAVAGLALGNALLAGLYWARSRNLLDRFGGRRRPRSIRELHRSGVTKTLVRIGAASLTVTFAATVTDLLVRTVLLHDRGAATAGIWFGLTLISVQFIGGLAGALSYLTAPLAARAATRKDKTEVAKILDDSWRLGLIGIVPVLAVLSVMRESVVPLLFSEDFSRMSTFLPAQTAGDALRSLCWILGVALIPLGYTRAWMLIGLGTSVVFGAVGGVGAAHWGISGVVGAWILMWGLALAATVAQLVRGGIWRPTSRSLAGTAIGTLIMIAAAVLMGRAGLIVVVTLSVWLVFVVALPQERAAVTTGIRKRLGLGPRGEAQ